MKCEGKNILEHGKFCPERGGIKDVIKGGEDYPHASNNAHNRLTE